MSKSCCRLLLGAVAMTFEETPKAMDCCCWTGKDGWDGKGAVEPNGLLPVAGADAKGVCGAETEKGCWVEAPKEAGAAKETALGAGASEG